MATAPPPFTPILHLPSPAAQRIIVGRESAAAAMFLWIKGARNETSFIDRRAGRRYGRTAGKAAAAPAPRRLRAFGGGYQRAGDQRHVKGGRGARCHRRKRRGVQRRAGGCNFGSHRHSDGERHFGGGFAQNVGGGVGQRGSQGADSRVRMRNFCGRHAGLPSG